MQLGKNYAQIVDHGLRTTQAGGIQVFIRFSLSETSDQHTWYGSPFKKDTGEINTLCIQQLVYAGFDPATMELEDLNLDGTLDKSVVIDIYAANQTQSDGSLALKIANIGPLGPLRATSEAVSKAVSSEQKQKLKEMSGKFKSAPKVTPKNPDEVIPF